MPLSIGPYVAERLIGRGAMAAVYLCRDPSGQAVAVKWLDGHMPGMGPEEGSLSPALASRFEREVEALERIRHPGVVAYRGHGLWLSRPYLVMDLVEGTDLRAFAEKLAARPPLERYARARTIGQALCEAVGAMHEVGLVHRDVKPANVLVDPDGRVVLTDLGVVRDLSEPGRTQVGVLIGTVAYAAPEQIEGGAIDARTDLYGVGATIYYVLTLRRPHESSARPGDGLPVPPSRRDPELPADLEAVILRLMAPRPEDRYADAAEAAAAFSGAGAGQPALPLAGRGSLVAAVTGILDEAEARGDSMLLELLGKPGVGRRWLAGVVRSAASRRGLTVVEPGHAPGLALAVQRAAREPGTVVLCLGAGASSSETGPEGLRRERVEVLPLGVAELRRTVVAVAPLTEHPARVAERLHRFTGGLPVLILPLLEACTHGARLRLPEAPPLLPAAQRFLHGLELDAIEVLGALALCSGPASADQLSSVAALPAEDLLPELAARGLVSESGGRWSFLAECLRVAALDAVPDLDSLRRRFADRAEPGADPGAEPTPPPRAEAGQLLFDGQPALALEQARRDLADAQARGARDSEGWALAELGGTLLELGQLDAARRVLANCSALAKAGDDAELRVRAHVLRALAELGAGGQGAQRRVAAATALDRVVPLAAGAELRQDAVDALVFMAWACAAAEMSDQRASLQAHRRALERLPRLAPCDRIRVVLGLARAGLRRGEGPLALNVLHQLDDATRARAFVAWQIDRLRAWATGGDAPAPGALTDGLSPAERAELERSR